MRKSNINDCGVQHLHEGGHCDDKRDRPWVMVGRFVFFFVTLARFAHGSCTVGSTEMPSGRRRKEGGSPESIRILIVTRRTILTKLPVAFSAGKAENSAPEPC